MFMKKLLAMICALCLALGCMLPALAEEAVGMANPWVDSTRESLIKSMGFYINVPEEAEDVHYSCIEDELLAQASFQLNGADICYRMKACAEFTDISGLYYTWEAEEDAAVGWCTARVMKATDGENQVKLMLWFDAAPGMMYSLSAVGTDLSGVDLSALAQKLYTPVQDEADGFDFSELADVTFEFSSGAGGWGTTLRIDEEGNFTGEFHDSEMGETGEDYPNGTVYGCSFHGNFDPEVAWIESHTWMLSVENLELDEGQLAESIEDGIRYVTTEPYGLQNGHDYMLYTPGLALDKLPEACLSWLHLEGNESGLPCYALYDATEETAFVGWAEE